MPAPSPLSLWGARVQQLALLWDVGDELVERAAEGRRGCEATGGQDAGGVEPLLRRPAGGGGSGGGGGPSTYAYAGVSRA